MYRYFNLKITEMLPYFKRKKKRKNTRWRHRPFAMKLVRFIVHTSSTKADFIMKCELGPVYHGEGNTGARVTLALAHFFFFFTRCLQRR